MFTEIELKIFNMNHLQEFKLHKQKKNVLSENSTFFPLIFASRKKPSSRLKGTS